MKTFPLLVLLSCAPAFAQSQRFEAVSIHLSEPGQRSSEFHTRPGFLMVRNFSLHGCIEWAYNLRPLQIEGPAWLRDESIDIDARAENHQADDDDIRLMLQSLLADRFGLKARKSKKEQQVFLLTLGKDGPKFHAQGTADGSSFNPSPGDGPSGFSEDKTGAMAHHVSMYALADKLSELLNRIVIDRTGLEGNYDLRIDVTPYLAMGGDGKPDIMSIIFAGLNDQLGLTVEAGRELVELLTIDSINKTPTAN
ncbi:MAG TPA: TIGR03435 family protein [Bryobacteraceae bacterium]|nr:TIGR03435 family protein [Bryobacteraceae bacterium]